MRRDKNSLRNVETKHCITIYFQEGGESLKQKVSFLISNAYQGNSDNIVKK